MEPKKSWDDIPSLDGLSVDWDYKAREKVDNRSHSRLDAGSLQQLFETGAIPPARPWTRAWSTFPGAVRPSAWPYRWPSASR